MTTLLSVVYPFQHYKDINEYVVYRENRDKGMHGCLNVCWGEVREGGRGKRVRDTRMIWLCTVGDFPSPAKKKTNQVDYSPSTDPINRLARHEQTTIFRLRTGHCGLREYLKRIGIMDSALCDCKEEEQTVHHILQDRPKLWPQDESTPPTSCGERRKTCAAPPNSWQHVD